MKRLSFLLVFLGLLCLSMASPCCAGSIVCTPPTFVSYVIIFPEDVAFNFKGTCNVDSGESTVSNAFYYIEAHWQKPIAQEYIKVDHYGHTSSQNFTSHCQNNPWLTDGGPCPIDPFDQNGTVTQFFPLSPDSKIPISWNAIPPDKKAQIAIEIEQLKAKSSSTQKSAPKQPTRIMTPLNNQIFYGSPAKVPFRILHDPDWPVKFEFLLDIKVGGSHAWTPHNVTVQNQKTVSATGSDGVTPVKITSGEAALDAKGEWKIHVWYDYPASQMPSWVNITVQPFNPGMMPQKTIPPGMIKLK